MAERGTDRTKSSKKPGPSNKYKLAGHKVACTHPHCDRKFVNQNAMNAHIASGIHDRQVPATSVLKVNSPATGSLHPTINHLQTAGSQSLTATPAPFMQPPKLHGRWTPLLPSQHIPTLAFLATKIKPRTSVRTSQRSGYTTTPQPAPHSAPDGRSAVALDCEMVGIAGGKSVLGRLTAIDFLTGETLIDSLVKPSEPVLEWRASITGITPAIMSTAMAARQVLRGTVAARKELSRFVCRETIIVGHALVYDLKALAMMHKKVVDSQILFSEAVGVPNYRLGLKRACKDILSEVIQEGVHDWLIDAFASRELVLWYANNPEGLSKWAAGQKAEQMAARERRKKKKQQKAKSRTDSGGMRYTASGIPTPQTWGGYGSDSDGVMVMTEAEFKEMCHLPEWYDGPLLD